MYSRQYLHKKTSSNTSSKPAQTNLSQQRPSKDEADSAALPQQQQETPDLQTQLERATRFGHNFGRVQVQGDTPSAAIQPKLAIGAPGDKYEQEADQVATQVMGMAAPVNQQPVQRQMAPDEEQESVQTKPLAASITPLVQREMAPEQEEEEPVQTKPLAGFTIQREMAPEEQEEEPVQMKRSPQHSTASSSDTNDNLENQLTNSKGGGSALPDNVRAFMEPRFGADFSQVRVHTDSKAVQMNQAVGAQAFTHGNDIYFGAGKSPTISDLTAHELTHVVQQSGATGKAQFKLNVSTGLSSNIIARDMEKEEEPANVAKEMSKNVDAAAEATTKDANYQVAGNMSTVNDSKAAAKLIEEIKLHQPYVERGEASGLSAWKGSSGANITAIATLEQMVSENDIQNTAVSQFKQQYQKCQIDFNRMDAAFQTFDAENSAGLNQAKNPDQMMNKINKGVMLTSFDDDHMKKDIGEGGPAFALWKDARDKKNDLAEESAALAGSQSSVITKMHSLSAVQSKMNAGVLAAKADADPDKQQALDAVKAKNEETKKLWSKVSGVLSEPLKGAASAANPAAGKAVGFALDKAPDIIDLWYSSAISLASLAASNSKNFNQLEATAAAQSELQAKKGELTEATLKYVENGRKLDQTKHDYLAAMEKLGTKLDGDLKTGNNAYAQITKLTSEAANFVAQANATIEIGKAEQAQAAQVTGVRDKLIEPKYGKAMPWFSVRQQTPLEEAAGVNSSKYGILVRNEVTLSGMTGSNITGTGADQAQGGSAYGKGGANELIERQIQQLLEIKTKAEGIKNKLEAKLGF